MLFLQVGGEGVGARRPAVALAQQANEERAAGADFVEAELEGLLAGALFLGNAPAQVHLDQLDLEFAAAAAKLGPGMSHQFVALFHHVAKGGGDEDADAAPLGSGPVRFGFFRHKDSLSPAAARQNGRTPPNREHATLEWKIRISLAPVRRRDKGNRAAF